MFEALRWRLTAWYVFAFAVVFAVIGLVVFVWANHRFSHDVDSPIRAVSDQVQQQVIRYGDVTQSEPEVRRIIAGASLTGSADVFVLLLGPDGEIAANPGDVPPGGLPDRSSVRRASQAGEDWREFSVDGQDLRVRTVALYRDGRVIGYVQAGQSVAERDASLRTLAIVMTGGGLAGLALATVGGLFVAGLAIRPVKRSFERQREFVADASHELRTPLAVIRVNAEVAATSPGHDEALVDIATEASYMTRLLDDLLLLAGSDREGLDLQIERADLADIARSAVRAASRLAEASGIELTVEAVERLPVDADPARCREVLLILLDNAVKYTAAGGAVALRAFQSGDDAVITVTDTGIGLASDEVGRVFDRFYRVDKARSRAMGGTGLGLSIAREIVEAHTGSLRLESEAERGTTATLRLPLTPAPRGAAT
jgi:two-component system sensor histidine kinase CiaH